MRRTWLLLFCLLLLLPTEQIEAQDRRIRRAKDPQRIALVIGNDAYRRSPLVNAVNDARAMGQILEELGFEVTALYNADQRSFDHAVNELVARLGSGDVALFYYAGHGVRIDTRNYLIPVDFEASDVIEVKYRAYPADLVRERVEETGTALNILIFDACRDNPFRGARSLSGGLAQMETGTGTFVAFSTAPGRTADDDPAGGNGLFTHHVIEVLRIPGLSLDEVFNQVRRKVYVASAGKQLPWTASSVIGEFHFRSSTRKPPPSLLAPELAPGPLLPPPSQGKTTAFTTDATDPFCQTLEEILGACSRGFKDLIDPARAESRTFFDPKISFPGAWYAKIFWLDMDKHEFLSSFPIGPEDDPEILMSSYFAKLEECLAPRVVDNTQRDPDHHHVGIISEHGLCNIDVFVAGHDVDIEILDYER